MAAFKIGVMNDSFRLNFEDSIAKSAEYGADVYKRQPFHSAEAVIFYYKTRRSGCQSEKADCCISYKAFHTSSLKHSKWEKDASTACTTYKSRP